MSSVPPPEDPAWVQSGQPGYPQPNRTNGVAIAALVIGLLSLPLILVAGLGGLTGLVAIVLGAIGINRARGMGGTGKGMAITGIVTGLIAIALVVLALVGLANFFGSDEGQELLDEIEASFSEIEADGS